MGNFSQNYDETIRALEASLGNLIDNGAGFDLERNGDVLNIEFEDGEKIVITPQSPLKQVWVSANFAGHRFNRKNDQWLNEKSGEELNAFLSAAISTKVGSAIQL